MLRVLQTDKVNSFAFGSDTRPGFRSFIGFDQYLITELSLVSVSAKMTLLVRRNHDRERAEVAADTFDISVFARCSCV